VDRVDRVDQVVDRPAAVEVVIAEARAEALVEAVAAREEAPAEWAEARAARAEAQVEWAEARVVPVVRLAAAAEVVAATQAHRVDPAGQAEQLVEGVEPVERVEAVESVEVAGRAPAVDTRAAARTRAGRVDSVTKTSIKPEIRATRELQEIQEIQAVAAEAVDRPAAAVARRAVRLVDRAAAAAIRDRAADPAAARDPRAARPDAAAHDSLPAP